MGKQKTNKSSFASPPSGRKGKATRGLPDTPGGSESVNSAAGKPRVPDNVKKQFADDLEELAGIKQFGKGKTYTLSTDIFAKSDTYIGWRRACKNLFNTWSHLVNAEEC